MSDKKAFRCKKCGFLEVSDHAAENCHPHACRVCGSGVVFKHEKIAAKLAAGEGLTPEVLADIARELASGNPMEKTVCPDNWEVLADATDARLAELGLSADQVERHEQWPAKTDAVNYTGRHIMVTADHGVRSRGASETDVVKQPD